jgi:hypothetical protein
MLKIITLSLSVLVLFNFDAQAGLCSKVDDDVRGVSKRPLRSEMLQRDVGPKLIYILDDRVEKKVRAKRADTLIDIKNEIRGIFRAAGNIEKDRNYQESIRDEAKEIYEKYKDNSLMHKYMINLEQVGYSTFDEIPTEVVLRIFDEISQMVIQDYEIMKSYDPETDRFCNA